MAKHSDSSTSALAVPAADFTSPGVEAGPFDIPKEWLAGRSPAEWVADRKTEEAELKRQRAIIDRANNAEAIRHEAQLKELRAIREALISGGQQDGTRDQQDQDEPPKKTGERIRFVLQKVLYPPDGRAPADLMNKQIIDAVKDEFRKRHWKLPGDETIRHIIVDEIGR